MADRSVDDPYATPLAQKMIDISQRCYGAEWLGGLEERLSEFLKSGPGPFGNGEVTADDIDDLRRLSLAAGGAWARWSDEKGRPVEYMPVGAR